MSKLIVAYTNLDAAYPGYINFTREENGTVSIHFRGDPSKVEGCYVCGFAADRGLPGRCTPGDVHCNNYCNMAPEKGPMQNHPNDCSHLREGKAATLTLSAVDFEALAAALRARAQQESKDA